VTYRVLYLKLSELIPHLQCLNELRDRRCISVCDQPPRSTQPGHRFVGRRNEYQPKGGDALRLGSKGRYIVHVWVAGKTV